MPNQTSSDLVLTAECERVNLSIKATYQIEAMIDVLLQAARGDRDEDLPFLVQGMGVRIHDLNSIIMSALGDAGETETELRQRLYGRYAEVANV